eukprot:1178626-Prorocentrum_minimum.AAC.4
MHNLCKLFLHALLCARARLDVESGKPALFSFTLGTRCSMWPEDSLCELHHARTRELLLSKRVRRQQETCSRHAGRNIRVPSRSVSTRKPPFRRQGAYWENPSVSGTPGQCQSSMDHENRELRTAISASKV